MKRSLVLLSVVLSLVLLFSIAGCTPETPAKNEFPEKALIVEEMIINQKNNKITTPEKTEEITEPLAENAQNEVASKEEKEQAEKAVEKDVQKEEPTLETKAKATVQTKEEPKEEPKEEVKKEVKKEKVKQEVKEEPKAEPKLLTKAEAKEIALKAAGVKAANISDYEIEFETDSNIYEISFETKEKEYEYEINATSGKIVKKEIEEKEKEEEPTEPKAKTVETPIYASTSFSDSDAKKLVLKDAGVTESKISAYKIESSRQGMILVYEISFKTEKTKYEYKVNALFGTILEAEKEAIK